MFNNNKLWIKQKIKPYFIKTFCPSLYHPALTVHRPYCLVTVVHVHGWEEANFVLQVEKDFCIKINVVFQREMLFKLPLMGLIGGDRDRMLLIVRQKL